MNSYHMVDWLLFFYIYCFIGWVWESCYVSVLKKKWVNRGFMHGPFLPIYGFGAITILVMTIPVQKNLLLVFLFGMIGATILEYVTGVIMEKLFHVRYWDYSKQPFNINGHICLFSSLAWGGFSILMVKFIHHPFEKLVLQIPENIAEIIAFVTTIVVVVDFTQSFNEAMDLKELLENLSESNEEIRRLKKRIDVIIAVADNEYKEFVQKASDSKSALEEKLNDVVNATKGGTMKKNLAKSRAEKTHLLISLSERLNAYMEMKKTMLEKENRMDEMEKLHIELEGFKESLHRQMSKLHSRSDKSYNRSLRLLRRNPDAISKKYPEALKEVQDLDNKKN